jgi:hypothetical protein
MAISGRLGEAMGSVFLEFGEAEIFEKRSA